jgi:hypothetical protein
MAFKTEESNPHVISCLSLGRRLTRKRKKSIKAQNLKGVKVHKSNLADTKAVPPIRWRYHPTTKMGFSSKINKLMIYRL